MKSLLEYTDYRAYVGDYYSHRKSMVAGFSWREFARRAGYSSPVFLKLVVEGKANLSDVGVERVGEAMGLTARDQRFFRELVAFDQSKESQVKRAHFEEMRRIAAEGNVQVLGADQYDFYGRWHNAALRELLPQLGPVSAKEAGALLQPPVPTSEVHKSMALLERTGILQRKGDAWEQTQQSISTGSAVTSLAVRDLHRQMGELAVSALESIPPEQRDISGLTLGLSAAGFERLVQEIAEFRRRVVAITTEDVPVEKVYRINLQLFPLSREIPAQGGNDAQP